jgi:hypothetical protein
MESKSLILLLDLLVLVALGGAIVYMKALLSNIKVIREGKTELQQLLQQLNVHISNAQHSVDSMKKLADDKAKVIQKLIENATASAEELQFIQKAADNVAQRLEKLTGQAAVPIKNDQEEQLKAKTAATRPLSRAEQELTDAIAARRNSKALGE